ncbi:Methyltransferase domain-containing protein [Mariprofundus ferrinatatus]|uniref:Methyltransferase domain-containing protein n=1 Tax=Mariprofundus ferrinatatus TaxID=1921087 RepID=A0A2K8LDN8_9PROT|nr:class I SAM-dependent methyltransferase [Mariprofundus ferrinatatus]ATX83024.1 Methyltransferase domain-containing protein [Mariprofundus ferrinatatus]
MDLITEQTEATSWPAHAAAVGTHDTVMRVIRKHLPSLTNRRTCDLPCGAGLFSKRLHEEGAEVFAFDIEDVRPYYGPSTSRALANANDFLPIANNTFDLMVSIEGIEHVENGSQLLREMARCTKDDGIMVISTPNTDSFRSRIVTIWKGYPKYFNPMDMESKASGHLQPVDMVFMHGAAKKAGLEIIDIQTVQQNRDRGVALWLQELVRPWFTRSLPEKMRGKVPFYGDVIIYVLRKQPVNS